MRERNTLLSYLSLYCWGFQWFSVYSNPNTASYCSWDKNKNKLLFYLCHYCLSLQWISTKSNPTQYNPLLILAYKDLQQSPRTCVFQPLTNCPASGWTTPHPHTLPFFHLCTYHNPYHHRGSLSLGAFPDFSNQIKLPILESHSIRNLSFIKHYLSCNLTLCGHRYVYTTYIFIYT